ncbi:MAG: hypothetical protein WB709_13565 [Solirubrobacteraceae bacterium]
MRGGVSAQRLEQEVEKFSVGLKAAYPVHQLRLQPARLDDRLTAGVSVAAGRVHVAAHARPRAGRAVHPRAAALAVEQLAQQVLIGGWAWLDDRRAPRADFLHAVEQLLADDRLVQSADAAALVAQPGDITGVGGVAQHLSHGVLPE